MRRFPLLISCIVVLACGGGQGTREAAQSPDTPAATATTPASADAAAPPTSTDAATTTPASSSAAPPAKMAHTHDPGRGTDDINAIVKAHRDEARACYDRALQDHPGIEGDLVITWTIDPKGNVTTVSLDGARSTIAEASVVACVSEIIRRIQFAPSPGGFETKASYPFNFHPRHNRQSQ